MNAHPPTYRLVDLAALPAVDCPCGHAQRAFADLPDYPATLHRTKITLDAKPHFHRRMTEVYYFLECQPGAAMELDGQRVEVRPGMAVLIPPDVVHRAVGRMTILNFVIPKFDPADEFLVDEA